MVATVTTTRGGRHTVVEQLKVMFTKVSPEKLKTFLTKEKPAECVFVRMGLNKAKGLLFSTKNYKKLDQWLTYVDDLSAKNPAKRECPRSRF